MKTLLYTILIATFSLLTLSLKAQDYIRIGHDSIPCKVEEIGLDEIKFKSFDNLNGPVNVIEKRRVSEIIYENGKHEFLYADEYDANPEMNIRNKTHAIKFEFFSPLNHNLGFGYEKVTKVGMNVEFKVGIIGPGAKDESGEDPHGFYLKAGLKFLTSPTYYVRGTKYAHGLKGFYIKPEIIYSHFTIDKTITTYTNSSFWNTSSQSTTKAVNYSNGAFNIVFGKQHILGNILTLDYYGGIGYGFQSRSKHEETSGILGSYDAAFESKCYSHLIGESGFALSGGMTIGVIF